jgi:hypothetical protein
MMPTHLENTLQINDFGDAAKFSLEGGNIPIPSSPIPSGSPESHTVTNRVFLEVSGRMPMLQGVFLPG